MTQRERIIRKLKADGRVTRNEALRNYISRLGAIIDRLKKEGYVFHTYSEKGDYVYQLMSAPYESTPDFGKENTAQRGVQPTLNYSG